MGRFILFRLIQAAITLLALSAGVFFAVNITGDVVSFLTNPQDTQAERQAMRERLGLDRPVYVQYAKFLGHMVQGDFGDSPTWGVPARDLLAERLPNTIKLAGAGFLLTVIIGIPLGIISAVNRRGLVDRIVTPLAIIGMAAPQFWVGVMLILLFGAILGWLPTFGMGGPKNYILPAFAISLFLIAGMVRLTRSSMLEVLDSEYIKFARVKGLADWLVIWKHALKNAVIPVMTFAGISLGGLLNGSIVVEVVFAWPGVGRLMLTSVTQRDFTVVEATVLTSGGLYILMATIVDILYAYVDPRIRET
jgi:ABC-type dipeptide/oligopeptide/nickel transport system permease component